MELIVTTPEVLKDIINDAVRSAIKANLPKEPDRLYTINQVAKKLGLSFSTIKKKVVAGSIRSTRDGLIPESAINEYLVNSP